MCLGDGVHADKSQIVECPYYSSFSAMGFYALLLSLVVAYVSFDYGSSNSSNKMMMRMTNDE